MRGAPSPGPAWCGERRAAARAAHGAQSGPRGPKFLAESKRQYKSDPARREVGVLRNRRKARRTQSFVPLNRRRFLPFPPRDVSWVILLVTSRGDGV